MKRDSIIRRVDQEQTTELSRHEWDFSGVPAQENEACCLYEYGREFFRTSHYLQKFFADWKRRKSTSFGLYKALDLLGTRCENFPRIDFRYFPEIAWQDLSDKWPFGVRTLNLRQGLARKVNDWSERVRKSRFDKLNIATLRELEPSKVQSLAVFQYLNEWSRRGKTLDQTEYGFFSIDWNYSDSDIQKSFKKWLIEQRKKRSKLGLPGNKFVTSRGGFVDKLNKLGALRIKKHYRKCELVSHGDTKLKIKGFHFSHYPDLCEAAKKAEQEIARLFPEEWNQKAWWERQRLLDKMVVPLPAFLVSTDSSGKELDFYSNA